jgi:enoyl-CoA hydratase/carnithine racemase
VAVAKQLVNAADGEAPEAAFEGLAGALASYSEDGREGVASFREKRPPRFSNR